MSNGTAGTCEKIQGDVCEEVGYSYTSFPNLNGDISEEATNETLNLFGMIEMYTHCYSHVVLMGCATYLPKCSWNGTVPHHIIPPCRSLCQGEFIFFFSYIFLLLFLIFFSLPTE